LGTSGSTQTQYCPFQKAVGSDFYEAILPLSKHFADYVPRIADVLEVLSVAEHREINPILTDLTLPPADLVRFRVINPSFLSLPSFIFVAHS
jgi:hypothetical protein